MFQTSGEEGGAPAAILAVDDVPANLLAVSAILEPLHDNIITAASGRDAVELAGLLAAPSAIGEAGQESAASNRRDVLLD